MEDVKWLLRRCGLPILLLLIFVIACFLSSTFP